MGIKKQHWYINEEKNCLVLLISKHPHKKKRRQWFFILIDKEDSWLLYHRWYIDRMGYPVTKHKNKNIRMHRLLFPNFKITDHINRNKLDNRKNNLRECSSAQNAWNRTVSKNSQTGIMGVYKRGSLWEAGITSNGKSERYYFKDKQQAIQKRKELEHKYYGEFAPK